MEPGSTPGRASRSLNACAKCEAPSPRLKGVFCFTIQACPSGEIGRHSGLKIRRFPEKGRTGSIPVSGTSARWAFWLVIAKWGYSLLIGGKDPLKESAIDHGNAAPDVSLADQRGSPQSLDIKPPQNAPSCREPDGPAHGNAPSTGQLGQRKS